MTRSDQRAQEIVASKGYSKEGLIKRAIKEKLILTCDIERHPVKIEPLLYGAKDGSSGIIACVVLNKKDPEDTGDVNDKTDIPDDPKAIRKGSEPVPGIQRLYFFEFQNVALTEDHFEDMPLTDEQEDWDVIFSRLSQ